MTLIDHKIETVNPSDTDAFIATLNAGYEVINSAVLPDGNIQYVLRRMIRNGAYAAPVGGEPDFGR